MKKILFPLLVILLLQIGNAGERKKRDGLLPKAWPSFIPQTTAHHKEAEELFSELKPDLFALFPQATRKTISVDKATALSNNASFYKILYTLYPVAEPVSQKDMNRVKTQLKKFYDWLNQWDAMTSTKIGGRFFQSCPESSAKPAHPEIIPRLGILFFGDNKACFDLNISFITRENDTLIIMCDLYMDLGHEE